MSRELSRRALLVSMAASAAVVGCAGDAPAGACAVAGAQPEGDHYRVGAALRSDITEGKDGIALTLLLQVVDAGACLPIVDAEVDVWHADADGEYSDDAQAGTEGETFLRGIQRTDDSGWCRFQTIFPGFYVGRTCHISVKVRAEGFEELTTQLYFPREVILAVAPEYPAIEEYTTNLEDAVYAADNELALSGDIDTGLEATVVLAVGEYDGHPAASTASREASPGSPGAAGAPTLRRC